jgi:hypothetical protein
MARRKRPLLALTQSESQSSTHLEYEGTSKTLTASAGLSPILDMFLEHPLFPELCAALPQRISNASYATETFAVVLIAGFLFGYDCLEDLEQFQNNPLITERFGLLPSAKAFGDWLRDFEPEHIEKLKCFLLQQAHFSRLQINPNAALVIDMDSTSHIQHGIKLEGLDYDYKGNW